MNRRKPFRVIATLALVVLLTPVATFGQQAVQPQPGPAAGVFPTVAVPAARGVAAPAKAPGTELHAPAPRSDRSLQETQQLKQQALTRRDTGGANFYNNATLTISGSGVTLTNIVRVNNSLITATFNVAPGASAGPRDVRVVTLAGTSAPVPFTVQ